MYDSTDVLELLSEVKIIYCMKRPTNKFHSNFKNNHLQAIIKANEQFEGDFFMAKYKKKLEEDIRCPLEYGLAIFGGKWKSRIICVLAANEKLRYSQLRKEMYNITDAVLASTLKDLVEDGIVARKSYDEIPPRVEYSLTEKGKSVVPILQSICQWSDIFYKEEGENEMVQCQKCDYRR